MEDATLPFKEGYSHIKWEDYLTNYEEDAIEFVADWIKDNARIIRYIKTTYDVSVDYNANTVEELVDTELEVDDEVDRDEYEFTDESYLCDHCDKYFDIISSFNEHAIEVCLEDEEYQQLMREIINPETFVNLLVDYVFKDKDVLLLRLLEFVMQSHSRSVDFIVLMNNAGKIPSEVLEKYKLYTGEENS